MTYSAKEQSQAQGAPFECYEFQSPAGTFRYTSLPENVTLNGQVWTPLPIKRSGFKISQVLDGIATSDIMVPLNSEIANIYSDVIMPEYLTIFVYRAHVGDDLSSEFKIEWRGEAIEVGVQDDTFIFRTQSILAAKTLNGVNTIYYQYSCNNRVYDERCALSEADFRVDTSVTAIDNIRVTVASIGAYDGQLSTGKMINQRTNEQRSIYGNASTVVTLSQPFRDLLVGDDVYLVLGCDNRRATCFNRFDNIVNFNGFPYIPTENPFRED